MISLASLTVESIPLYIHLQDYFLLGIPSSCIHGVLPSFHLNVSTLQISANPAVAILNADGAVYKSGGLSDCRVSWSINSALSPQFSPYDRLRRQPRGHPSLWELHCRFLQEQCHRLPRRRRFHRSDLYSPHGNLALPCDAWSDRVRKLDRSLAGRRADRTWGLLRYRYRGTFDLGWF